MHIPVLSKEIIQYCNLEEGDVVIDATVGSGGHTISLAKKVGPSGKVIAIDVDAAAVQATKIRIKKQEPELFDRVVFFTNNFANISKIVEKLKCEKKPKAIVADLGWRIEQIEGKQYGMSFKNDFPLDMRLSRDAGEVTAADIVNRWNKDQLRDVLMLYGDESYAKKISQAIVQKRKNEEITTTGQLSKIVCEVKGSGGRIHPATKTFQALRIVVNDELENLKRFIDQSIEILDKQGTLLIISFHSIEDRIVKERFRINARGCVCPKGAPLCTCKGNKKIEILTKKPITADEIERKKNKRSRSAKLRVAQKK